MLNSVSGKYIIDKLVVFEPVHLRLINITNQKSLLLKEHAARCLYMMLSNHATLVSQNELMAYAWGEDHRQVHPNTFYQTILALRKSLTLSGAERDIIVTIPRKGLLIPENISVTFIPDNIDSLTNNFVAGEIPESIPLSEVDFCCAEASRKRGGHYSRYKNWFYLNKWSAVFLMILLINVVYLIVLLTSRSETRYFNDYEKLDSTDCSIFINPKSGDRNRQLTFLKNHPELCDNKSAMYITSYKNSSSISLFICTQPFNVDIPENCTPYYYPNYLQEADK